VPRRKIFFYGAAFVENLFPRHTAAARDSFWLPLQLAAKPRFAAQPALAQKNLSASNLAKHRVKRRGEDR
jgi:hypothetical protein